MANTPITPPPKTQSAADEAKKQIENQTDGITNAYSIAKKARDKRTYHPTKEEINNGEKYSYGDLRAYHNFRKAGNNDGMIGNPRTYSMSAKDFIFSNEFTMSNTIKNSGIGVQPIILNEFQPLPYRDEAFLAADIASFTGAILNAATGGQLEGIAANAIKALSGPISREVTGQLIKSLSENPNKLFGDTAIAEDKGAINPMSLVKKLFGAGRWLNTYELPFFNNTYLEATAGDKWSVGGISKELGDGLLNKFLKEGMNIDFPTAPQFQPGAMGENGYKSITLEFYLINCDSTALQKNFEFLHAFYAGTQWLQLPGGIIYRFKRI
jgi:hypothetical protein